MTFNFDQALLELTNLTKWGPATPEALLNLARHVSVDVSGSITVLYSGKMSDGTTSTSKLIQDMLASGQDIRVIDNSPAAYFLNSREFKDAVAKAFGIALDDLFDETFSHPAKDWLMDGKNGSWADASKRFAEASSGDIRVIAPEGNALRIFAQTELPALLDNPKVTHIDGIPREPIIAMRDKKSLAFVQKFTFDNARLKIAISALSPSNLDNYLDLTSDTYSEMLNWTIA